MAGMMTQAYTAQPGMGPVMHHGMVPGHPMAAHPQMGQPTPVMQTMHPGMPGPQVTQAMIAGMPPNPGTPIPGTQMHNSVMTPMGVPNPMFAGQNSQMNMGQLQMNPQSMQLFQQQQQRRAHMAMMSQQQSGQMAPGMANMQNMMPMNPMQMQQMRLSMGMQPGMNMTPQSQQQMIQQQASAQHHTKMMQQQHALARQQSAAQIQQANMAQHVAQQMQMSRSNEPMIQPPQPPPTPAPQSQPASVPTPNSHPPPPSQAPKPPQTTPLPINPAQSLNVQTPQPKQDDSDEESKMKSELPSHMMLEDMMPATDTNFSGQCILQLLSYQDTLANPVRPHDISYWQEMVNKYFSPKATLRQQVFNTTTKADKSFQLNFPSLARFYHAHFRNGVQQILVQSFEHAQEMLQGGGTHIYSTKAILTYIYKDGVRIVTHGQLRVNYDIEQKIEHLYIAIKGWTEYLPRNLVSTPLSPESSRQSPKMTKKNLQRSQQTNGYRLPTSPVGVFGLPDKLIEFLEIVEVMTTMVPLMSQQQMNPNLTPRELMMRSNQMHQMSPLQMQGIQGFPNMGMNGQIPFQAQMRGMNPPTHFQSPHIQHLGLPNGQGSPHINHTPSPGQMPSGSVPMMQQMSAQGSNLSGGSQGASTNTSPNVSNKRRRASQMKDEDPSMSLGGDKTKPSPRIGKRQKGQGS